MTCPVCGGRWGCGGRLTIDRKDHKTRGGRKR